MGTVNFEPIGKVISDAFDSDRMDISRRVPVDNPDGTTGETGLETPIYSNIICHISFVQIDNPDPNTVETRPIIQMVKISCSTDVDLQNGDLITAYKKSDSGETLDTYIGIIGEPVITMSRQTAEMQIREGI